MGVPHRLAAIDKLLRGGYTSAEALADGRVRIPIRALVPLCLLFGVLYGASMGLYSALGNEHGAGSIPVLASALKVPLLFLLTLCVTFPSLYVVSALARSRLAAGDTLRLLLAAIAVQLALLASLAPVAAFFTVSTDSYPFMKLLHAALFAGSGLAGLTILFRALGVILGAGEVGSAPGPRWTDGAGPRGECDHDSPGDAPAGTPAVLSTSPSPALSTQAGRQSDGRVRTVFRFWVLIYGCVGAQMGWILRPFIGSPELEFTWFRARESNFLIGFLQSLADLF